MSELKIYDNGHMVMADDPPTPFFENGDAKFSVWISNWMEDENADRVASNWFGASEVGFLVEFTPSQLLNEVESAFGLEDGISTLAKPSLEKMRAELVSMIERIDQMKFVEEA